MSIAEQYVDPDELRRLLKDKQPSSAEMASCSAAVLVPLIASGKQYPGKADLLLTHRAQQLNRHAGEIAFPGGRYEDADKSLMDTALRESWEEVGLDPEVVEILGCLTPLRTRKVEHVLPCVAWIDRDITLKINPAEVQQAFSVPLDFFRQENLTAHEFEYEGRTRRIPRFEYQNHNIWGFTASVISMLCRELLQRPLDLKILTNEQVLPYQF